MEPGVRLWDMVRGGDVWGWGGRECVGVCGCGVVVLLLLSVLDRTGMTKKRRWGGVMAMVSVYCWVVVVLAQRVQWYQRNGISAMVSVQCISQWWYRWRENNRVCFCWWETEKKRVGVNVIYK